MRKATEFHLLESGSKQPLVWESDGTVFEHGGLDAGYQAELAFDVKKPRGVVVLSNCGNVGTFVSGVWRGLLEGCSPKPANSIQVDHALYDDYTGLYEFVESQLCGVRHDHGRLMLHWIGKPGQRWRLPSFEVFPQSESIFRNEFWQIQARFIPATNGQPPGFVLTSLGSRSGLQGSAESVRISTQTPPTPAPVHPDPAAYDDYVGQYRKTFLFGLLRVGPTLNISHKKDELGSHLVARVRGMGITEIFPTGEASFIVGYDVGDDLRLTFVRNKKGTTKGVHVLWNGRNLLGTRISNQPN
jgi:hypothetical protein